MKELNLYNAYHLGDNIYNINFFNKYTNYDYVFNYYIQPQYFNELSKHIINPNIKLLDIHQCNRNNFIDCWINGYGIWSDYIDSQNNMIDLFYVNFFKKISNILGIECLVKDKSDILFDNTNIINKINKKFDFLIVNEFPYSGQFNFNIGHFSELFDFLHKENISFISTTKTSNAECTRDYNMSIVDIGFLSESCNNIISVNTAPICSTFNVNNINTVNKWFVLDNINSYSYNHNIIRLNDLSKIYKFL